MKTHALNISYLVMGVVFLGIAASWGLRKAGLVDVGELEWMLPLTLIVAGVVGLAGAAAKSRATRSRATADEADPTHSDPDYYDTEGDLTR